jgi:hypothetical protein
VQTLLARDAVPLSRSKFPRQSFFHRHSLSLIAVGVLGAWIVLYARSDPKSHAGAFYGNAIADWSGTVCIVIGTKYLFERGSAESRSVPRRPRNKLARALLPHSLSIALVLTGLGWLVLYSRVDPQEKWGQVVGNILSEWVQMLGIVLLTKSFLEVHSQESRSGR